MQRSFKLLLACALLAGVTLRADNDGEGGIMALIALVQKSKMATPRASPFDSRGRRPTTTAPRRATNRSSHTPWSTAERRSEQRGSGIRTYVRYAVPLTVRHCVFQLPTGHA